MGWLVSNLRYKLVAMAIAVFLWGVAHGSATVDRPFDVPVVLQGIPEHLVVTGQSVDAVNLRIQGRRAVLRNLSGEGLEYPLEVSEVKPGEADFEVDTTRIELPRGLRIVSRSPSVIQVSFERRGRKTVRVRADLEGEPAEGFQLVGVELEPASVRIAGARSEVVRLAEVVTEPIDLVGATESVEREVRLLVGARNVWVDDEQPVVARVHIEPREPEPDEAEEKPE